MKQFLDYLALFIFSGVILTVVVGLVFFMVFALGLPGFFILMGLLVFMWAAVRALTTMLDGDL